MSPLPPPPIRIGDLDPVWQRWFRDLFLRVGGTSGRLVVISDDGATVNGIDELEERLAAIPERPDVSALESRLSAIERQIAGMTSTSLGAIGARLSDIERQLSSLAAPSLSNVWARLLDIEGILAGLTVPSLSRLYDLLWDDVPGPITLATGVAALTLEAYQDTPVLFYHMRHDQDDAITINYQMPHGWNPTTAVKPHIHWIPCADPASDEVVRFTGQYAWTTPAVELPADASWTTFAVSATVSNGDAFTGKATGLATVAPPAGVHESAILVVQVMRPGSTDAADTYTTNKGSGTPQANVALLSVDTHYRKDKAGTNAEFFG